MKIISATELNSLLKDPEFLLIDIREHYEREICSIKSLHITMEDISEKIDKIPMEKQICILCKTGKRASAVANLLETDFNYKDVMVVDGGLVAYKEQVDPSLEIY